jgi:hypothetical protein
LSERAIIKDVFTELPLQANSIFTEKLTGIVRIFTIIENIPEMEI